MKKLSLKSYYRSFFRNNISDFVLGVISTLTESACMVGIAWLIQQLLDACSGNENALPFSYLLIISISFIALYFGAIQLDRITTSRFIPRATAQYKCFIFSKISEKSISAFRKENTATYISAITNDIKTIQIGIFDLFGGIGCILRIIFAVCLMISYSVPMTLGALAISALLLLLSAPTGKKLVRAEREVSDSNETVTDRFKDFLSGFSVVKSFGAEKQMYRLFSEKIKISENADKKRRMADMMFALTIDGGLAAARIAVLLVGVWMAISGKGVSAGMVVAFVQLLDHVLSPAQVLPLIIADLKAAEAIIRKTADNLEKNIRDEGEDILPVLKKGVIIKSLSFSYEPGKEVLHGIDYTFEAGKRYALVGTSGCGKTTLLHLLMGGNTYEGSIFYDDRELKGISSKSLYEIASLISQNVFLFNATILENITMFREFPKEEIENAIKLSGLSTVISQKGTHFLCGENGCNLSGGEKQRVSVARCLLRKTELLLVDEATSSLDKETAAQVSDSLLDLQGVTEITVTHSLDAQILRRFDKVIAMKSGRLEEIGSFDELMEQKGYFYSLYTVSQ